MNTYASYSSYLLKEPRQARARQTVDALLTATEQLLVARGWDELTTNKIADRAGVSIGTLYQYFENKQALVGLLAERFIDEQFAILATELARVVEEEISVEDAIPLVVSAVLEAGKLRPELSRVFFEQLPVVTDMRMLSVWTQRACAAVHVALATRAHELREGLDIGVAAHILVTSLHGIEHSTVLDRPDLLEDDRLATEVSMMVRGYLLPSGG